MLTVAQLAPLKDRDPYLYETLVKIVSALNASSQRAGVDPSTPALAPSSIASLTVHASNGWFDLAIADPANSRPGLFYFAESPGSALARNQRKLQNATTNIHRRLTFAKITLDIASHKLYYVN